MTKLSVLAAIALASSTIYAHSCDRGIHAAANATPIVACNSSECAIDESVTPQQPVATPETAAPKIACEGSGCNATDDPPPSAPVTTACSNSDC
jgi:hypothetical protein